MSTATADGLFNDVVLSWPPVSPGFPICSANLPALSNLRTCASSGLGAGGGVAAAPPAAPPPPARPPPRPPPPPPRPVPGGGPAAVIQTLPLAATAMPPGDWGHA